MKNIAVILVTLMLVGCKTTGTLQPIVSSNQKAMVRDGMESLFSQRKHTVVMTPNSYTAESSGKASFIVIVSNGSSKDFLLSPSNISATAIIPNKDALENVKADSDDDTDVVPMKVTKKEELHVYTYEELVKEEEKRAAMQAFAIALGSVGQSMEAANAGYQSGYGTVNTYGTYGSSYGTYNYSGYDYAAANAARSAAQAQTNAEFSSAAAQTQTNLIGLKNTILKAHTLLPNESHGGIIQIQMPAFSEDLSSIPIDIIVMADDEEHNFHYSFSRDR